MITGIQQFFRTILLNYNIILWIIISSMIIRSNIRINLFIQLAGFAAASLLLQFKHARIQLIVSSLLPDQLIVAAALNDAAVFKHHDDV